MVFYEYEPKIRMIRNFSPHLLHFHIIKKFSPMAITQAGK
jgi:hypothetical protein